MNNIKFEPYRYQHQAQCLSIFDDNCPTFFAPNEREDYLAFLTQVPAGYEVCILDNDVVGVFGLLGNDHEVRDLNWILLSKTAQGQGIGRAIMERVTSLAQQHQLTRVAIAASHLSAPFFAKFGAKAINEIKDGWGPDMHRIDMVLTI